MNNVAAAGEVTDADTLMQYLKQLINILIGTPGIGTFPAEAAPGNAVSLAEVIRAIHVDVTGLNGDSMVAAAPTAVQNRTEMDSNSTQLAAIVADTNELQVDNIPGTLSTIAGYLDTEIAAIKAN